MKFTLKQLEIFLALVDQGSTLAAAEALGLSQPAVSSAIAGLEANLETALFHRWKMRMLLNDRGRHLLPRARSLLSGARELEMAFSGDGQISGTLRLGASRTLASYVIPEVLLEFAVDHPSVNVEMVSRNKSGITEGVEDFSIDIGIIAGYSNRPALKSQLWLTDELCVFAAPGHPLAAKKNVSVEDLARSRWVVREEGSGTLEVLYGALPDQVMPLQVMMVFDNLEAIKRTVEKVNVLSCISRFALRREIARGDLVILRTPYLDLKRRYSFLMHREKEKSILLNYFINHCHTLGQNHGER